MKIKSVVKMIVLLSIVCIGMLSSLWSMESLVKETSVAGDPCELVAEVSNEVAGLSEELERIGKFITQRDLSSTSVAARQLRACRTALADIGKEVDRVFSCTVSEDGESLYFLSFDGGVVDALVRRIDVLSQDVDDLWFRAHEFSIDDEPVSVCEEKDDFSMVTIKQRMRGKFFDRREKKGKLKALQGKKRMHNM